MGNARQVPWRRAALLVQPRPGTVLRALRNLRRGIGANARGLLVDAKKSRVVRLIVLRRPVSNLGLHGGDAIARIRVIAQEVRALAASRLLQLLKELRQGDRI